MNNTLVNLRRYFYICIFLFLNFYTICCNAQSDQADSKQVLTNQMLIALEAGDINFDCRILCAYNFGSSRRKLKGYFDEGAWDDLISKVIEIGYDINQSYYYLGRAMEAKGNFNAAIKYYVRALYNIRKCFGPSTCDGIIFPDDIQKAMLRIQKIQNVINNPIGLDINNPKPSLPTQISIESSGGDVQAADALSLQKQPVNTQPVIESVMAERQNSSKVKAYQKHALVVGNDNYKYISKLINAREDAKAIAQNLAVLGYEVTLKLDVNEREMKSAIRAFSSKVNGGDEVVLFYAGHGVQIGTSNFLLPIDVGGESEAQVRDESITLQRLLDDMSERKAKFTLALVDACRDNPFKSIGRSIGGRGLAPTTAATGQMIIFSAGVGQQALDRINSSDSSKNSLFTRIFLQEMQKTGISIDRVMKNVRNQVADIAKSVGHDQVPAIYDQVLGDFYFKN